MSWRGGGNRDSNQTGQGQGKGKGSLFKEGDLASRLLAVRGFLVESWAHFLVRPRPLLGGQSNALCIERESAVSIIRTPQSDFCVTGKSKLGLEDRQLT